MIRIEPVDDRIMSFGLRYNIPITIISIYAPPSERTTFETKEFHEILTLAPEGFREAPRYSGET